MGTTYLSISVFWAALALAGIVVDPPSPVSDQIQSKKQTILDTVPKPKHAEIRRIRTAEEWRNPYLIVCSDGFELLMGFGGDRIRKAHVAEIEEVLLNLPRLRWPLGRVVAVQDCGLRNPGETVTKEHEEVLRMLKAHKVVVELRPSG